MQDSRIQPADDTWKRKLYFMMKARSRFRMIEMDWSNIQEPTRRNVRETHYLLIHLTNIYGAQHRLCFMGYMWGNKTCV